MFAAQKSVVSQQRNFILAVKIAFSAIILATVIKYCLALFLMESSESNANLTANEIIQSLYDDAGFFSLLTTMFSTAALIIYLFLSGNRHPLIFPDVIERLRPEILASSNPNKYLYKILGSLLPAVLIAAFCLINFGQLPSYFYESALISELLPNTEASLLTLFTLCFFIFAFSLAICIQISLLAIVEIVFFRSRFISFLNINEG